LQPFDFASACYLPQLVDKAYLRPNGQYSAASRLQRTWGQSSRSYAWARSWISTWQHSNHLSVFILNLKILLTSKM